MFMFKRSFNFRNVAAIIVCLAVSMMFASCKDKDNDNGSGNGGGSSTKLSPPAWIQGSWGVESIAVFKFTASDVVVGGVSLKTTYVGYPGLAYSFKETKTDALYEIKITAKAPNGESAAGTFSFKKGDGTYIEAASVENNGSINPSDYERFDKIN
jgi:hypothetical protein